MWSNYHTHSNFCDGKGDVRDYVERAQTLGMHSLGLSSHAPLPFDNKWCMQPGAFDQYQATIASLKQGAPLDIYKGLEVDFIPGIISPADFQPLLDYTIGSIHFVDSFASGRHWEIDGAHTLFLEGLEQIFRGSIRDVIVRYFELTRDMIETACPDVVGHLDKIKIQNIGEKFFSEHDAWYREEINKTVAAIARAGAIVEVNTRGLYQKKSPTTYPSPWILEKLLAGNVSVTISSDAHHPDDLVNQFPQTAALLHGIGFKKIAILQEGRWHARPFDQHGILIT